MTTMPIEKDSVSLTISYVSSSTKFIKGSKPRRTPSTLRFPSSLTESFFSMNLWMDGDEDQEEGTR